MTKRIGDAKRPVIHPVVREGSFTRAFALELHGQVAGLVMVFGLETTLTVRLSDALPSLHVVNPQERLELSSDAIRHRSSS